MMTLKAHLAGLTLSSIIAITIGGQLLGQALAPKFTPRSPDATTLELYREYIAPIGKIETSSVLAAVELVSKRAEGVSGFQEMLMKDFEISRQVDNQRYDAHKLLLLITAILSQEGQIRWQLEETKRTGFPSQRALPAGDGHYKESMLLSTAIERGRQCDRSEIDAFVFAVRQSHHPQGKQFLLDVLNNPSQISDLTKGKWPDNIGGTWQDARFHAAVGLAELGVEEGVQWLIGHAKENDFGLDGTIERHQHATINTGSLRANCNAALDDLSGLRAKHDESREWDKWWRETQSTFTSRRVALN